MGRNALHRAGHLLAALDAYEGRRPVLDGCEYREALQAVFVEGGVAGNVVPDLAVVTLNHRFAPDRTAAEARAHVEQVIAPHLEPGDEVEVVDVADAAPPGLRHPLLATLRARNDLDVRAKFGWTDVSRFAAAGIPAANFGPGDSALAHTRGRACRALVARGRPRRAGRPTAPRRLTCTCGTDAVDQRRRPPRDLAAPLRGDASR